MYKLFICTFIFSVILLFSSSVIAQDDDTRVVHVQTFKMIANFGDDAEAFGDMLRRQSETINKDERVLSTRVLRHYWGADSRDLVLITEFKDMATLEAFYNDMNFMMEEALGEEQSKKDNDLWNKYVGMHSDEVYSEMSGTRK